MPVLGPASPLQRSARDFIKSALRLVGALRSGLSLSADEEKDCQQILNDWLDALSAERVSIPAVSVISKDQNGAILSLAPAKQAYTLGNANENEDLLLPRPSRIERVSILYSASQSTPIELPMEMVDDVEWQRVANKSTPSLLPQVCFADESNSVFPDTVLSFYPVPTQANPIIIYAWVVLGAFADLTAPFFFPPAYAEMIRFNLAVRFAAEFPCDLQKFSIVQKLAIESKMRVTSINVHAKEAVCDEAIVGSYGKMGNIFTGTANRSLRN